MSEITKPVYIFENNNLKKIKKILKRHSYWALFLDFDGTLAHFTEDPNKTKPLTGIANILNKIVSYDFINLVIISGRKLEDLKKKIKLKNNTYYAGLHGLEMDKFSPKLKPQDNFIKTIKNKIRKSAFFTDEVKLEDKGGVLSIHHTSSYKHKNELKIFIKNNISKEYKVMEGRQIIEIKPKNWDKGKAVMFLLRKFKYNPLPIYIGDDTTDEDAFEVIENITIHVKNEDELKTKASYYLHDPVEVKEFLKIFLDIANKK
ncbi:MAG: trehalose-phosphatase [Bacillota bacterium]